ncbi:4'-phosphopantetheinyl transferase superfamily protein [Marinimicrobium sp. ABcell2]|uniref:4'-phosphopantetheinyl transferase family protein n=1 Tax=Marinimicrobium sp. ABcell2 TaxID=3069751 RepID=UPI0027B4F979|nr:4'-phosphopantetheinyl transferase superfamily protein [Marinimicrobium sp. ABcell2]MDQ2075750.1 4'-phosphopantetheinyl transferase superfamily protein [Marinimicrobium sp. ABcell2]
MMLLPQNIAHIWLVDLRTVPDARLEDYRKLLSEDELARLENYKNPKVQRTQLITRAAVRVCLSQYSDSIPPKSWRFERNEDGKPQLVQPAPMPLSFNLSHSGDWLAIAVTVETPLGVDVQHKTTRPAHLELAQRYFHPDEVEELEACPSEAARLELFFRFWTLKEAYLKARGTGIVTGLEKIRFHIDNNGWIIATMAPELDDDSQQWQFHHYHLGEEYSLSLAVNQPRAQDACPCFYKVIPLALEERLHTQAHRILLH